jgi:hypothetical protein
VLPSPADTAPSVSARLGNSSQLYPTASDKVPRTMVAPQLHAHCTQLLGTQFVVHPSTRAAHSIHHIAHHGGSERLRPPRRVLQGCAEGTPRRVGTPRAAARGEKHRSAWQQPDACARGIICFVLLWTAHNFLKFGDWASATPTTSDQNSRVKLCATGSTRNFV